MRTRSIAGILLALRLIAGAVFLYAGWEKLRTPQQFADAIAGYQLVPVQWINWMALALPPLEMMIGSLLVIGLWRRLAAFAALVLAVVFLGSLGSAIARGLSIDCGCFGAGAPGRGGLWLALLRDVVFTGMVNFIYTSELAAAQRRAGSQ